MNRKLWFLGGICALLGVFAFLIQQHWIVIRVTFPFYSTERVLAKTQTAASVNKMVTVYRWQDGAVAHEESSSVWGDDVSQNVKYLSSLWVSALYDERIITKRISIESVLISQQGQTAYISFSAPLFSKQWSIYQKWQQLEALLKTFRQVDIGVREICLLAHHKPMEDEHLDFTQPIPIDGFVCS